MLLQATRGNSQLDLLGSLLEDETVSETRTASPEVGSFPDSLTYIPVLEGFLSEERFMEAYKILKDATSGFKKFSVNSVMRALQRDSAALVVVRCILGVTPPEWASYAETITDVEINTSASRRLDSECRKDRGFVARLMAGKGGDSLHRIRSLVTTACVLLERGAVPIEGYVNRFDKWDTRNGFDSLIAASRMETYPYTLFERYTGRPYASLRDAASDAIGDQYENEIVARLVAAKIPHEQTSKAERIKGHDQAGDIYVPNKVNPEIVIEAKISNDEATARDKIARIKALVQISREKEKKDRSGFEVIACIDGRDFLNRRNDVEQLFRAVKGKVFKRDELDRLVDETGLKRFVGLAE